MTTSLIRDLPLPLTADKLCAEISLKALPALTLVDLATLGDQLAEDLVSPSLFLTASEQEKYASYTYAKRRMEWLGGRIAAKKAGINLLQDQAATGYLEWQVITDQHGRPYLRSVNDRTFPSVEISISHSGDYGVALAVFGNPCGIDIQKTSPAVVRVQEKFCPADEESIVVRLNTNQEMGFTLLWSAKEALRKARGGNPLTGFLEMHLTRVRDLADHCWLFSFQVFAGNETLSYQTVTFIYQDYGCSIALA